MRSSVGGPPVDVNRADGSHADGNVGKNARGMALPRLLTAALCALAAAGCVPTLPESAHADALAQGIVWQLDNEHLNPHGDWNRLGVSELLVQWTAVDDVAFVAGTALPAPRVPDWVRIANEPWARDVIVGLAGYADEQKARAHVAELVERSLRLAAVRPPVHVTGWYFPVEVDPSWTDAASIAPQLERLPKPLWISVYDNRNIGGAALAQWLGSWLPGDVGVLLQDGCGVYARGPAAAREYADALSAKLGNKRVRIIAEAFRPKQGGGFRAATAAELAPQLEAYRGYRVYLFDGPHYVSDELVEGLLQQGAASK
ncbi:hypothetical protein SAMN05216466_10310 [Paraburkholderia phenazinium]|uniref:Uncharacterized protein n=2 Tax=Paraburkholderia phenazinium TaxID=60549 RepID=A0A1G7TG74_9BURK|nr:hypothetical protein [Paraburkholderia phenazinium]SDG34328.1 hypothetical protein SAMN05216466_10310 [Paraburkholderia phenazinium]